MAREVSRRRPSDGDQEERTNTRRGRNEEPRGRGPRDGDDSSYDEGADRPSRSRRSRDDEGSGRREEFQRPSNMGRGRASVRKARETRGSGDFPDEFRVKDDAILIKFLEADFFTTYYEHWIQEFNGQRRQMSFVCLGDDCPLCEIGDKPGFRALINVLDLSKPNSPAVKVWKASANPADAIEDEMPEVDDDGVKVNDNVPEVNDVNRYFEVSKKKQRNNTFAYKVSLIRGRDLAEEGYDFDPLTAAELDDYAKDLYTEEQCVRINPRRDLLDVAAEISGD